jgi:hypothetical protein
MLCQTMRFLRIFADEDGGEQQNQEQERCRNVHTLLLLLHKPFPCIKSIFLQLRSEIGMPTGWATRYQVGVKCARVI